jgi:hypothetical protein
MITDYGWSCQQQYPLMVGEMSAGMLPTLGSGLVNRADSSNTPPHQGGVSPDIPLVHPQTQAPALGYPDRQYQLKCSVGSVPLWGAQLGTADTNGSVDVGQAGRVPGGPWHAAPLDSPSASLLAVSVGAGAFTGVGNISDSNGSEPAHWPLAGRATGGHDGQQTFPSLPDGAPSTQYLYDPRLQQSGVGCESKFCHGRGL